MKRFSYVLRSYSFYLSTVVVNSICVGSSVNSTGLSAVIGFFYNFRISVDATITD